MLPLAGSGSFVPPVRPFPVGGTKVGSQTRAAWDASTGEAQGWDIAMRPNLSEGMQSGFVQADLIGRESTGGNRRAGAVFF
jgi:hypothetical protein